MGNEPVEPPVVVPVFVVPVFVVPVPLFKPLNPNGLPNALLPVVFVVVIAVKTKKICKKRIRFNYRLTTKILCNNDLRIYDKSFMPFKLKLKYFSSFFANKFKTNTFLDKKSFKKSKIFMTPSRNN